MEQLPEHRSDQTDESCGEHRGDERRTKPVVDLTAIQEDFQSCRSQTNQQDTKPVDAKFTGGKTRFFTLFCKAGRVVHKFVGEKERKQPEGDIDEKDPAPSVVVGDPAAQHGTDSRCGHDRNGVERKSSGTL